MTFQVPTPEDRLRSRTRARISLISPALGRLTDLALQEAEPAADPAAAESAPVSRLRQAPDRKQTAGPIQASRTSQKPLDQRT
jgi:hypothetical protein